MTNSLKTLALTGALIYLFFAWLFYFYFQLGDDTYIYLQYVKNFLANGELAFNSGTPSYGFTAPLWFFMMAFMVMITGQPLASPALLSIAFGLASVILWAKIIMSMTADTRKKILFLLLVALDPNLLKHAWMGMEATGSFFFSSLLIYYIFIRKETIHPVLFGLLTGLFFFVRPESVLISAIMMAYLIHTKKYDIKNLAVSASAAALIVLPWLLFAYLSFGIFFPSTFDAKGGAYPAGVMVLNHIYDSAKILGGNYLLHLLFFLFIAVKRKTAFTIESYYALAASLALLGFYFVSLNAETVYARYFCAFIPFLLYMLFRSAEETDIAGLPKVIFPAAVLLAAQVWFLSSLHQRSYIPDETAEDTMIAWVTANTPADAKIVRVRIGKIGYLSEREIIDPVGLINPDIIPYNVSGTQIDYYRKVKPGYFIYQDDRYLKAAGITNYSVLQEFTHNSHPMVRNFLSVPKETKKIIVYRVYWD